MFSLLLASVLSLVGGTLAAQTEHSYSRLHIETAAPLEASQGQGVAGAFAGVVEGKVFVAGGCNFPNVPASEGGTKVYYPKQWVLLGGQWQEGETSRPVAYGMSVQLPEGLLMIGGTDGQQPLADVRLQTRLHEPPQQLPSLPQPMMEAGAAFDGQYIYVAGGRHNLAFRMAWPEGKHWEALPPIPGRARVQPAAAAQHADAAKRFYLFGGYAPAEGNDTAFVHSDGYWYDAAEGQWQPVAEGHFPQAIIGSTAVCSGVGHVLVFGGVNRAVFLRALNHPQEDYLRHEPSWYGFRQEVLVYHTLTNSWTSLEGSPLLARAGAAVIDTSGGWTVVGGELMPGIRATDTTVVRAEAAARFGWLNWLVLAAYLLGMLALGWWFMRREASANDFFKGGGRIPWWAAGISIYATMLSAITYMAIPAKAYATDWTYYPMLVTILLMAFPVVRYYLPYFRKLQLTSAYEYLEMRFNALTRLTASALFITFMLARTALVLYLPSLALTAVTGIDIRLCITLMGLITVAYCTMGGVEAVVWGDVVQGIILVGGAFLAAAFLICNTEGGAGGFVSIAMDDAKLRLFDWTFNLSKPTFWVIVLGGMANNLISYTSDQTVIQRYMTTRDERGAGRGIMMNGIMSVGVSAVFYLIGTGLYTFYKTHPAALDIAMDKTDAIFPFFMMSQLPAGLAGLLIAAIFSATMSTVSSNINSIATAFSIDFFKRFKPQSSDRAVLTSARLSCLAAGLLGTALALLMATWQIHSLLDYFNTILGLLSSGIGGLFFMGIFLPRIGGRAAMTGFIAGQALVFWLYAATPVSFLLFGFVGVAASVVIALAVSMVYKEQ